MNIFLIMTFLFFIGSLVGWGIEVIFRRFFSSANPERKWINPGFLIGPYLPLYGFSLCILYTLASLDIYLPIKNMIINHTVLFIIMAFCVTIIEYIAGIIFIKGMNTKLWDYTNEWGNIKGIICPKFSFFWVILSAIYYFLIHPHILSALKWLSANLAFSFCIGFFFGVFVIDVVYSAKLMVKIKNFAAQNNIIVRYEELRNHIALNRKKYKEKAKFFFSMHSSIPFAEHLKQYYEIYKESLESKISHK